MFNRINTSILLAFSAFCVSVYLPGVSMATEQIPEELTLNGIKYWMRSEPLEDYFSQGKPKPKSMLQTGSNCWRGYVGKWEIINDGLVLRSLAKPATTLFGIDSLEVRVPISLRSVFPSQRSPVPATWYTGIVCAHPSVPLSSGSSNYDTDVFFLIHQGQVVRKETYAANWRAAADFFYSGGPKEKSVSELEEYLEHVGAGRESTAESSWIDGSCLKAKAIEKIAQHKTVIAKTSHEYLRLSKESAGIGLMPEFGCPVELTGYFDGQSYDMTITGIRRLNSGEEIHKSWNILRPIKEVDSKPRNSAYPMVGLYTCFTVLAATALLLIRWRRRVKSVRGSRPE
jgi:hypothetical protein